MPRPETTALYEQECPVCLSTIYEGDKIGLIEPGGDWACFDCAEGEMPWEEAE